MRSGDALRRDVLRMASSAAYNVEKRNQRPLTDDEFLAVLTREVKTRRESVEAYRRPVARTSRPRRRPRSRSSPSTCPQALTEAEIARPGRRGDRRDRRASARDMGKVMGWLSPRTRGRADGKVVSELVARPLAQADLAAHDGGTH